MKPTVRRERITDILRERERVNVDDLAVLLETSRETIRRDLSELADDGVVRKFHGGAALIENFREGPFAKRQSESVQSKRIVARAAAALYQPGDSIFIDTGSTTIVFAEELARLSGITVITNGPRIAHILAEAGNDVFVVGGEYRPEVGEMVGELAIEQISRFHASHAVLTVGGLTETGVMDYRLDEAQIARTMVQQATKVTVIADSSKLGRNALFQVCSLSSINQLVVDAEPEPNLRAAMNEAGVEVIIAR